MRAHLVQFDIHWENPAANFAAVDRLTTAVGFQAGDLIVLPEMFDSGFSFNVARTVDRGETLTYIRGLAARTQCIVHGHRTAQAKNGTFRNRATIVGPEGLTLAEYDKIHLFSMSGETERMTPGSRLAAYHWNEGAVCPAICYDLRFPELFRAAAGNPEVFAMGACWPGARQHHRRVLCIARAIENQAFVLMCNRCGSDPAPAATVYDGHSMVVDPHGEVLAEAGGDECVLSCEIDMNSLRRWREKFPAARDRVLDVSGTIQNVRDDCYTESMKDFATLNFAKWIADNKDKLRPPVSNKQLFTGAADVIVFVSGGPNTRNDFHVNPTEELFYQVKGDIAVRVRPLDGAPPRDVVVREGEMFLLPRWVPHRPQRPEGTVGLIVEFPRGKDLKGRPQMDALRWYCPACDELVYEAKWVLKKIDEDLKIIMEAFWEGPAKRRTCACGMVIERAGAIRLAAGKVRAVRKSAKKNTVLRNRVRD